MSVMRLRDAFENGHRWPLPLKLNDLVTVRQQLAKAFEYHVHAK